MVVAGVVVAPPRHPCKCDTPHPAAGSRNIKIVVDTADTGYSAPTGHSDQTVRCAQAIYFCGGRVSASGFGDSADATSGIPIGRDATSFGTGGMKGR